MTSTNSPNYACGNECPRFTPTQVMRRLCSSQVTGGRETCTMCQPRAEGDHSNTWKKISNTTGLFLLAVKSWKGFQDKCQTHATCKIQYENGRETTGDTVVLCNVLKAGMAYDSRKASEESASTPTPLLPETSRQGFKVPGCHNFSLCMAVSP